MIDLHEWAGGRLSCLFVYLLFCQQSLGCVYCYSQIIYLIEHVIKSTGQSVFE